MLAKGDESGDWGAFWGCGNWGRKLDSCRRMETPRPERYEWGIYLEVRQASL